MWSNMRCVSSFEKKHAEMTERRHVAPARQTGKYHIVCATNTDLRSREPLPPPATPGAGELCVRDYR
jgi:hypothetical protein